MATATYTTSAIILLDDPKAHSLVHITAQLKTHIAYLSSFANELETEAIQCMAVARKEKRFMDKIVGKTSARQAALHLWGVEGLNSALKEANVRFLTERRIAAEKWSVALQAREEIRRVNERLP